MYGVLYNLSSRSTGPSSLVSNYFYLECFKNTSPLRRTFRFRSGKTGSKSSNDSNSIKLITMKHSKLQVIAVLTLLGSVSVFAEEISYATISCRDQQSQVQLDFTIEPQTRVLGLNTGKRSSFKTFFNANSVGLNDLDVMYYSFDADDSGKFKSLAKITFKSIGLRRSIAELIIGYKTLESNFRELKNLKAYYMASGKVPTELKCDVFAR